MFENVQIFRICFKVCKKCCSPNNFPLKNINMGIKKKAEFYADFYMSTLKNAPRVVIDYNKLCEF